MGLKASPSQVVVVTEGLAVGGPDSGSGRQFTWSAK